MSTERSNGKQENEELDTPRKGAALGMEIVRSKDSYAGGLTAPSPKVPPYMQELSHFLGKLLSFTVHRGICFSRKLRKTNPPIALCKQKV